MKHKIFDSLKLYKNNTKKSLAVLIDPDSSDDLIVEITLKSKKSGVDFLFTGGSILTQGRMDSCIKLIKMTDPNIPVVIFPGSELQVSQFADSILLLSLISGRNPDFLIGKHVQAAPSLLRSELEIVPTGYILVDGGKPTSVSYISNTSPIPHDKPALAVVTALAGTMLGLQCIYMDAGSGAEKHVSAAMVKAVSKTVGVPLIVGGGIRNAETATLLYEAGADVLVIGNGTESRPELIGEIANAKYEYENSIVQKQF